MDIATLVAFTGAVLILLLSPGPNMIFVLSHSAAYGASGGVAAALRIAASDLVMKAAVATGLGVALSRWPGALEVVHFAGAAYLLWIAGSVALTRRTAAVDGPVLPYPIQVFWRVTTNGLLNPKALLFFLTFQPAFANATGGSVVVQLWVLGLWLTLIATIFHLMLGMTSARLSRLAAQLRSGHTVLHWLHAGVLVALAGWVLWA